MKNQMKSRKRVFFTGLHGPLQAYLEDMALQGWKLTDYNTFLYFEKIEPQKLHYSVALFPKASAYDTVPSPETEEWLEYCRAGGWQFVCSCWGITHIFVSDSSNPVPIETDAHLKLHTWTQSQLKHLIPLLFLSAFILLSRASDFFALDFSAEIRTNFVPFAFLYLLPLTLFLSFLFFGCWVLTRTAIQKRRLRNGLPLELPFERKRKYGKIRLIVLFVLSIVPLFSFLALVIAYGNLPISIMIFLIGPTMLISTHYARKRKYSRDAHWTLLLTLSVLIGILAAVIAFLIEILL